MNPLTPTELTTLFSRSVSRARQSGFHGTAHGLEEFYRTLTGSTLGPSESPAVFAVRRYLREVPPRQAPEALAEEAVRREGL